MDQFCLYIIAAISVDHRAAAAPRGPKRLSGVSELRRHCGQGLKVVAVNLAAAHEPKQRKHTSDRLVLSDRGILCAFSIDAEHEHTPDAISSASRNTLG